MSMKHDSLSRFFRYHFQSARGGEGERSIDRSSQYVLFNLEADLKTKGRALEKLQLLTPVSLTSKRDFENRMRVLLESKSSSKISSAPAGRSVCRAGPSLNLFRPSGAFCL